MRRAKDRRRNIRGVCAGGTEERVSSVGSSERAAPRRRSIAIPPGPSEEDPGAAHRCRPRSHRGRAKKTPALPVGADRSHRGRAKRTPALLTARRRTHAHRSGVPRFRQEKPGHPRGAGSARAVGRTGRRAGRPGPDGGNQLHPVVSPQFSHLWQVPLRTVSQPQRGQGGASGVELSRR